MHLTQVAQFVVAGSWRSIHARWWSFAIGSRTRRRAGTILSGCGGRKDFAARYAVGRITGLRSGACVTAGGQSADLGDGGDLVRRYAFALAFVVRSALARNRPEKRRQRPGPATGFGAGELSHGVEFEVD